KKIVGDPTEVPVGVEVRDGPNATHTLDSEDLIHDKEELTRDENSVIFRVAELDPQPRKAQPTPAKGQGIAAGRVTRQADLNASAPLLPAAKATPKAPTPAAGMPRAKPRQINDETRQVQASPRPSAWDSAEDLENIGERTMISAPPGMSGFMM